MLRKLSFRGLLESCNCPMEGLVMTSKSHIRKQLKIITHSNLRSIFKNCNMTPRLSMLGFVFFALKSLLGVARQWSGEKFAILNLRRLSHVRIMGFCLRYRPRTHYVMQDKTHKCVTPAFFNYCSYNDRAPGENVHFVKIH